MPTTWTVCPRDDNGVRGPIEEALVGTPVVNPEKPLEVLRVAHSFDPCLACTVHVIHPESNRIMKFKRVFSDKIGGDDVPPPKVLILGVGNILLRDDGFGVHLIQSLEETAFPPNVQILEAGTVSHQLIPEFRSIDYLIVIDAVEAGDVPGAIFRFSPDDVNFKSEQKLSLHQISLTDVLDMAALTGAKPKTVIIAVQPKNILWGLELSDEVRMAMPKVKELVFDELKKINALNYEVSP